MPQVKLDVERHEVKVDGKQKDLSPKEFAILRALAAANGKVVSREALLVSLWGKDTPSDTRTVEQHLARLRKGLGAGASAIVTVTGSGYKAVGVTFSEPVLCPAGFIHAVKRGDRGTTAEVIWKNAFPEVKKGQKVTINA